MARKDTSLIARWEAPNFRYDTSGNGNAPFVNINGSGSPGANLPRVGGVHDDGASFSGSDFIRIGATISAVTRDLATWQVPFTICCWAKTFSGNTNGSLFSQYRSTGSHQLKVILGYASTEFAVYYSKADGTYQTHNWGSVPTLGRWHFLAAVISGTTSAPTVRLHVDGAEKTFTGAAMSTSIDYTNIVPYVGGTNSTGGVAEMFTGHIGTMSLFKRALSQQELIVQAYVNPRSTITNLGVRSGGTTSFFPANAFMSSGGAGGAAGVGSSAQIRRGRRFAHL